MKLSIVVPTYNEAENIPVLVHRLNNVLHDVDFELVIVDDDSPDKTWEVAEKLSNEYHFIKIVRRIDERDLSTAVLEGFKKSTGDVLTVMDADLQHPPEKIAEMLSHIENNDVDIVVGSRYVAGGEIEKWGLIRKLTSHVATLIAHIFVPKSRITKDPLSGYFMIKKHVIKGVKLQPIGYKILLEILAKCHFNHVDDEPIVFSRRERGKSSLGPNVLMKYLHHVLRLSKESGELTRIAKFGLVGFLGVIVNLGVLWTLTEYGGIYYLLSAIVAIEISILSNFLCNDFWTFNDRRNQKNGEYSWLRRMIMFNLISLPAFPMQLVIMGFLREVFGLYYLIGAFFGILVVFIWNFVANSLWTWKN